MVSRHVFRRTILALVGLVLIILLGVEIFGDDVPELVQGSTRSSSSSSQRYHHYLTQAKLSEENRSMLDESAVGRVQVYPKEQPMGLSHNYSRTLVLGRRDWENVDWIDTELPNYSKAIYEVDNDKALLRVPKNKGHEVMVYLTYIIDHYDKLKDITVFIHSDRWAWHNNDLLDNDSAMMLNHLIPQRVIRKGYVNLKCQWHPGCPTWLNTSATTFNEEKEEELLIVRAWLHLFPEDPLPASLAQPCCSQFALSRDRILSIPVQEYIRLRSWLLDTEISDGLVGRIFEYIWQYLWTGYSRLCVSQHACYCDLFGACFEDEKDFQSWFKLRSELKQLERTFKLKKTVPTTVSSNNQLMAADESAIGRLSENRIWVQLLDARGGAFTRGRDARQRARIAQREMDSGDFE